MISILLAKLNQRKPHPKQSTKQTQNDAKNDNQDIIFLFIKNQSNLSLCDMSVTLRL